MKPTDKIEERIRRFEVQTSAAKDKAILELLLAEHHQHRTSSIGRFAIIGGAIAAAAGILIIAAIWLSAARQTNKPHLAGGNTVAGTQTQTLSELTSVMSLNTAFYRGGMEAVEKQLDLAEKQMAPKPHEPVTMDQWMCELLDDC